MVDLKNALLVAVLLAGLGFMSWGITTVTPRTVAPDTTATTTDSLLRLVHGTPFRANFLKGGNLHTHLLALTFLPRYKRLVKGNPTASSGETIELVGSEIADFLFRARLISLASGLVGLLFMIGLGTLLFGFPGGHLAAILLGTNLLYAHAAHLGTEDMLSVCLVTGSLYFLMKHLKSKATPHHVLAAIMAGLAISAKATAGLLLLPLLVSVPLTGQANWQKALRQQLGLLGWTGLAYLATTPSIVLFPGEYLQGIRGELANRWAYRGFKAHYPGWVLQFFNLTRAFSFPLFAGVLASSLGFAVFARHTLQRKFCLLSGFFIVPYFLIVGSWDNVNADYVLPIVPFLVLLGVGGVLLYLRDGKYRRTLVVAVIAMVGFSSWYTASAIGTFRGDSRIRAENYILSHVPESSQVDVYSRKLYLPRFPETIRVNMFPLMGAPGSKWDEAVSRIRAKQPDFIVMVSAHFSRYLENPGTYPRVTRTFETLLRGAAGYRIERQFGKKLILDYNLAAYFGMTWHPRPFHPVNPTVVVLSRQPPGT